MIQLSFSHLSFFIFYIMFDQLTNFFFYIGLLYALGYLIYWISRFVKPSFNLYDRYGAGWAVVTGGSDGIGLGFCQQLAKLGFNICIISRNKAKIDDVCSRLKKLNQKIQTRTVVADFTNSLQQNFFKNLVQKLEGLDISILVNNVGVFNIGPYSQLKHEDIHKEITINNVPVSMLTRLLLPNMLKRQKKGAIISLSSSSVMFRLKYSANYCSTKLFSDTLSLALENEYGDKIDFLGLRPGLVTTQMTRNTKSILHVSPNQCARGALRSLGRYSHYAGSWWHQFNELFVRLIPEDVRDFVVSIGWKKAKQIYKQLDRKKQIKL